MRKRFRQALRAFVDMFREASVTYRPTLPSQRRIGRSTYLRCHLVQ